MLDLGWTMRMFSLLLILMAMPLAANATGVDAAIVFAVDVSASIDPVTAKLQREGHVAALSEPNVIAAISAGLYGCIAITYIEWASAGEAKTVLPWSRICNREDAIVAAETIHAKGSAGDDCYDYCATSISDAIDTSRVLLDNYQGSALSKIIDISANGINNDGPPIDQSRQQAINSGYTINAIVIPRIEGGATYHLLGYFSDYVIGGPRSFAIEPKTERDYASALQRKLVSETSRAVDKLEIYETTFVIGTDEKMGNGHFVCLPAQARFAPTATPVSAGTTTCPLC